MTAFTPEPAAVAVAQDTGEELVHSVCYCADDVALCGADVAGTAWATENEEVDCVVCLDLMFQPCPRCGR